MRTLDRLAELPALVGQEVAVSDWLAVTQEQLLAGLKSAGATTVAAVAPAPVVKPEPAKPAGPQVIRIFGLDDGPREIVLR